MDGPEPALKRGATLEHKETPAPFGAGVGKSSLKDVVGTVARIGGLLRNVVSPRPSGHPKFLGHGDAASDNGRVRSDKSPTTPLSDRERERLETLLDALPVPLEPLDVSSLDGYLAGVLLQPAPVPAAQWLAHVHDVDARPAPPGIELGPLHGLVKRRHAQLERAITSRQWFDPWVFELEPDAPGADVSPSDVVLPWVAGFATAMALLPALMRQAPTAAIEPLATLFAHIDPDDLEDADELREAIDAVEPPQSVAEAVEDLVRCTLLLADVTRPRKGRARR